MPFTSVTDVPKAFAGQRVGLGPFKAESAKAEGAVVAGQPVLRGTDRDSQAVAVTNGVTLDASTALGFVLLDTTRAANAASSGADIEDGEMCAVLRNGEMYVEVTGTVVAGNPVWVGTATAQLGDIDDATGTGLTQFPGARFMESGTAGDLVRISLNMD